MRPSWLRDFARRVLGNPRRYRGTIRRKPADRPPQLEALETRLVPTTFTVTNTNDSGAGSLRDAIAQTNATSGADAIVFDNAVFGTPQTITLTGGALTLTDSATTTITGPAAQLSVSGNSASQVFVLSSGASASLSGLTVTGGHVSGIGGAVSNSGTLTMTNCTISGSSASNRGGGLANYSGDTATLTNCTVSGNTAGFQGGGIENYGSLTLTGCTVSGNQGGGGGGGGINTQGGSANLIAVNTTISGNSVPGTGSGGGMAANGTVSLTNCTISGNTANQAAGGINEYVSTMTLTNCTVTGNHANADGGGIYMRFGNLSLSDTTVSGNTANAGGGLSNTTGSGSLTIGNTIVSANAATTNPDIVGTINTDSGHNLLGAALSGTTAGTGDVFSDTPLLAALGYYGGLTRTMALESGSPALGAGNPAIAGIPATDQRGFPRVVSGAVDIGAFQTQAAPFTVVTADDTATGAEPSDAVSLRNAISLADALAPAAGATIRFDIPTSDAGYNSATGIYTIAPAAALPTITARTTIDGTTQPGYGGTPVIQLSGAGAGAGVNGLTVTASNSTIKGLDIIRFSGDGIVISGAGASGNVVAGNYVGTDPHGNSFIPNTVAWFKGEGNAEDTVGGDDGTLNGGVGFAPGEVGQAFNFPGNVGDYVRVPDEVALEPATTLSVDFWVKGSAPSGNSYLLSKGAGGDSAAAYAFYTVTGGLQFYVSTAAGGTHVSPDAGPGIWDNNWHHVAGTYDGSTVRLYVDGAQVGSATAASGAISYDDGAGDTRDLFIGNYALNAAHFPTGNLPFKGEIDEVGVYNRPLTAAEVQSIFTAGSAGKPSDFGNQGTGILVTNGAAGNTVGGTAAGAGNLVSSNGFGGVFLSGAGTSGNLVAGNLVGTNASGTAALGNAHTGVGIFGGAAANTIGGTTATARNVIGASGVAGVYVHDAGSSANLIEGDYIGTDVNGTAALGNDIYGVLIGSAATANTVGGTTATPGTGAGNVISGNGNAANFTGGVYLIDAGTSGNVVAGNLIGTDKSGTAALGNAWDGVGIETGASGNTIGGTAPGARNVISANAAVGVEIHDSTCTGNLIAGNFIGTDVTGTAALGNTLDGVLIRLGSANNTVGGTTAAARNVISGNTTNGVRIADAGTSGNVVEGDYIGTNAAGTAALANSGNGVLIDDVANNNTVGGVAPGAGNLISGNAQNGILINYVFGSVTAAPGATVEGNRIGTNAAGNAAVANVGFGIDATTPVQMPTQIDFNTGIILGTGLAGNVISGNTQGGIFLTRTFFSTINNNVIGTDPSGTVAVPNTGPGIVFSGSGSNTIGGSAAFQGNLVSGNQGDGIDLFSFSNNNVVEANSVGVSISGTSALGNTGAGVRIETSADGNQIGTAGSDGSALDAKEGNVISGNQGAANVMIDGNNNLFGPSTSGNIVAGNIIGLDSSGRFALTDPQTTDGVLLLRGAQDNTIGASSSAADTAAMRNLISGNTGSGVTIIDGTVPTSGNTVAGNYVGLSGAGTGLIPGTVAWFPFQGNLNDPIGGFSGTPHNGAVGPAFGPGEVGQAAQFTTNFFFGGPDHSFAVPDTTPTVPTALEPANALTVETWVNSSNPDPGGAGGVDLLAKGQDFVGDNSYALTAVNVGGVEQAQFSIFTTGGHTYTAQSTTSPFDGHWHHIAGAFNGATITLYVDGAAVASTPVSDGKPIQYDLTDSSLPSSTGNANDLAVGGSVDDNITLLYNGAIDELGIYNRALSPSEIQGIFNAGGAGKGNNVGNKGDGISVAATGNVVGGTTAAARNVLSGNASDGVFLSSSASANLIEGNYIGVDNSGNVSLANTFPGAHYGVQFGGTVAGNTLGGTTAGARNIISGNATYGVVIGSTAPAGNTVQGNWIGLAADGSTMLGDGTAGILVGSSVNTLIGGAVPGAGNVISGNFRGLWLLSSTGTVIQGNLIGTDPSGALARGNSVGIDVDQGSTNSTIGGTSAGARNLISGNGGDGIDIQAAGTTGNVVEGNYVGTNAAGTNLGNHGSGISVSAGAANNTVGGTAAGAADTIAFNSTDGVAVDGAASTGNAIRGNSIHDNAGLGIHLTNGGNNNQAAPALAANFQAGLPTVVTGTLTTPASATTYAVDFYANNAAGSGGAGQGQIFLGSLSVNSGAAVAFSATLPASTSPGQFVSATATNNTTGDTSQFAQDATIANYHNTNPNVAINGPANVVVGAPVALSSTISDATKNKTYTYAWNVTQPANPSFALPASAITDEPSLSFVPPTPGTYVATLRVTDNLGGSTTASLTLVARVPGPGVVIKGAPAVPVAANTTVSLTSTIAEPTGATPVSYAWAVTVNNGQPYSLPPGTVTTAPSFTFTPATNGLYQVSLTVVDSAGGAGTNSVFIVVSGAGQLAAIYNVPGSGTEGTPVVVNGASNPSQTAPFSYNWAVFKNGAIAPFASVPNDTTGSFHFTPDAPGSYQITLVVTDSHNHTAVAIPVTVPVAPAAPGVQVLTFPANATVGQPATLTGTGSAVSAVDPIVALTWTVTSGNGKVTATGAGTTFTYTPSVAGTDAVTLTALDAAGARGSQTVHIAVAPAATLTVSAPSPLLEGTAGRLTATVNNPHAGTYTFTWSVTEQGSTTQVQGSQTDTSPTSTFVFAPPVPGAYVVSVSATNTTDHSTVSVGPLTFRAANVAPTIHAVNVSPSPVFEGTQVTLSASAGDPGQPIDVLRYKWTVLGPDGFTLPGTTPTLQFTPNESGTYAVALIVTDSSGAQSAPFGTNFTVAHVPPVLVVQTAAGTGVNGSTLTANLTAALLNDPAGDEASQAATTYAWQVLDTTTGAAVSFSGQGTANISFSGPAGDSYRATVLVSDDDGDNLTAFAPLVAFNPGTTKVLTQNDVPAGATQLVVLTEGSSSVDATAVAVPVTIAAVGTGNDSIKGGAGPSVLVGDSGNNSLVAGSGPTTMIATRGDTLVGGSGPNLFALKPGAGERVRASANNPSNTLSFAQSGSGGVVLNLGAGVAQFGGGGAATLSGPFQTVVGSSGNDTLMAGGASNVVIQAGSGNAVLSANGGSSVTLFGGSGNDSLSSSGGTSVSLVGGSGNSTLSSSGGSSITLFGGSGNDSLSSSGGTNVTLVGSGGNNTLSSSGGSSVTLFGGSGNDSLSSSGGTSVSLVGGGGNSTLSSSGGSSVTLFGGTGNDSLSSSGGTGVSLMGSGGNNTLSSSGGTSVTLFGGTGNDSLSSSGGTGVTLVGGGGNETLSSSGGSSVTLFGGSGNDSLNSSGGTSVSMVGGSGNSTLSSSGGTSVTQFGGSGNDSLSSTGGTNVTLVGGGGNETLSSSGGTSVTLFGGSGNDSLNSSGGTSVSMVGGGGNSTLSSSGGTSVTQFGGSGNDSLNSSGGTGVSMVSGGGNSTLSSSGGTSVTQFGGSGNDSLSSTGGTNVTLVGGSGNETLSSSGGSSVTLFGGSGNDSLNSSGGTSVSMVSGGGNSTLSSSGGTSVTQFGGSGNDSLSSTGGTNVTLVGGSGNETLSSSGGTSVTMFGGSGNDSLNSSGGTSVSMVGGSGNSTLSSSGGTSVTQFGGSGNDSLSNSGGTSVTMVGGSGNSTLSSTGGSNVLLQGGVVVVTQGSGSTSVTMFGGSGNDSLSSSGGTSVTLIGGSGNSTLSSSGGSSVTIFGGTGNDSLSSSGGTSVSLVGGSGNSTLSSSGGTSVTQFGGSGNDSLTSSGGTSVTMIGGSGNSTLSSSGGSSVTLFGGTGNDSLSSSGGTSVSMIGGSGNSTLSSSGGTSVTLFGGSGNDSLNSSGGTGVSMVGGSGNSTLSSSGGTSVTQFGGSGNDSLNSSGGTSVTMIGGSGNSTLSSSGGTSVTQFGGSGNDSLSSSGGTSVSVIGGSGNDTLSSTGGSNVTLQSGGGGNDSITSSGGSSVTLFGGAGNDTLTANGGAAVGLYGLEGSNVYNIVGPITASLNDLGTFGQPQPQTDSLTAGVNTIAFPGLTTGIRLDLSNTSPGPVPQLPTDPGQPQLVAPGITLSLTGQFQNVVGTPGNDFIKGDASTNVLDGGGSGNDTLVGGTGPATLVAGSGTDSLVAGSGGTTFRFAGAPASLGNVTVDPPAGNAANVLDFSQLAGPVGSPVSLNLASTSPQRVSGGSGLLLTLQNPAEINGVIDTTSTDTNGHPFNDNITGNAAGDTFFVGTGNDSFTGGGGADSFVFNGNQLGTDSITENSTSNTLNFRGFGGPVSLNLTAPAGTQTLSQSAVSSLALTLSNPSAFSTVIGSPYGGTIVGNNNANETIVGGGGRDSLVAGSGSDFVQGYLTQVVYLDFPLAGSSNGQPSGNGLTDTSTSLTSTTSGQNTTYTATVLATGTPSRTPTGTVDFFDTTTKTDLGSVLLVGGSAVLTAPTAAGDSVTATYSGENPAGDHVYTTAQENAVLQGLLADYRAFNYFFTLDPSAAAQKSLVTGGQFVTIEFNAGAAGGASNVLDPGNLNLGGTTVVNVNPFLGDSSRGLVPPTDPVSGNDNIAGLTTTIAAHELGHQSGLQHQDAFGPIGTGIYSGVNPAQFAPSFPGPQNAVETPSDIMASPASVGSTLLQAAAATYVGERDAIKLAFNDTGSVLQQSTLATQQAVPAGTGLVPPGAVVLQSFDEAGTIYQVGSLPALAVPNTLAATARDAGKTFAVTAGAVNATITPAQVQYFAVNGTAGQVMTFQVVSFNNTLNSHPIVPALELLDSSGNLVPYYGNTSSGAFNIHEFESPDSTLLDVTLPTTGTYYVGVLDQASAPVGNYQLFMYTFAAGTVPGGAGGDTMVGGSGNDTIIGSSGNDLFSFPRGAAGNAILFGGSGQNTLDLSVAPGEQYTATGNFTVIRPAISIPRVAVSDAGGTFNGNPFPATATVAGVNGVPGSTLEGVGLTLTYYAGGSATGTPLPGAPSAVGTYTVVAFFPGSADYTSASAQTTFSITLAPTGGTSAFILSPSASGALSLSGNAQLKVTGLVDVDSTSSSAISASGNAQVSAGTIQAVGKVQSGGNAHLNPGPVTGVPSFGDPLANLAAPAAATYGLTAKGSVSVSGNGSASISQGIYTQISVSGNGKLTMAPGIYVIAGGGFSVTGNGSVSGSGIMIYNAGSNYPNSGGPFGVVNLSGNGNISLTAPTTGPYAGILIFQSRDNASPVALSGNGIVMPGGVIYAPAARLTISGNGQFKGSLVVSTLTLSGNTIAQLTAGGGATAVYAPDQVRTAYGINNLSLDGTGQTIAIVDAYDNPAIYQAVDAFDAQFAPTTGGTALDQLYGPASSFLTVVNQRGDATALPATDPAGVGSNNWEVETALDVEWAHAVAPGAHIVLVEADSQSLADLMTAAATAAAQPGVSVVSMSWGFIEGQDVLAADEALYDGYLTTPAGHPGVTFVASTGDYGAAVPLYPALSPNVVAVGGTSLTLNADNSYKSEVGWGAYSSSLGVFLGSGGGLSQYEAEPAFQQGVQSTGSRTTPDVSLLADPATGAWVADPYNLGSANPWQEVGGTSLSAPAWAGLFALVDQGRVASGRATLGTAGPTEAQAALYALSQADFHAVLSGSNGYSAGPGYNLVTGLGTPAADQLVPDLVAYGGGPASATPVAPIASSGLVYSGGGSGGTIDALARAAALRVFSAVSLGGRAGALDPVAANGPTMPAAAGHSTAAAAAQVASAVTGPRVVGISLGSVMVGGANPFDVAPRPGSVMAPAIGRWDGTPASAAGAPAWSPVLLDPSPMTGPVPAPMASPLRPEMPADGSSDVLVGGAGDDLVIGGEGHDVLVGGFASDRGAATSPDDAAPGGDPGIGDSPGGLELRFVDECFLRNGEGDPGDGP